MRAEHLYKRFGDKPVLENVSLTVPAGAVLCLMAPSGWGKTTLLRCMAGLEKPDSGTVRDVPERIGYVFQEDRLCGHMSAVENVRLATGRRMDSATIEAHLTELGLGDQLHQPVEELSGGQRRRVAIARRCASAAGFCCWTSRSRGWTRRRGSRRRRISCGTGMARRWYASPTTGRTPPRWARRSRRCERGRCRSKRLTGHGSSGTMAAGLAAQRGGTI